MGKLTYHMEQLRSVGLLVIVSAIAFAIAGGGCGRRAPEPAATPPEPSPMAEKVEPEPDTGVPPDYALLEYPFASDENSRATGKAVYDQYCVGCHGAAGKGDGPKATTLAHKAAVLSSPLVAKETTDGHLFWRISEGVPDEDMPAWKDRLTEQQRWYLVNYIRAFASGRAEPGERREGREGGPRVRGAGPRGGEGGPGAREGGPRGGEGGQRMREGGPREGEGGMRAREGGPGDREGPGGGGRGPGGRQRDAGAQPE